MSMYYQLLCGRHADVKSGRSYTAGDIVKSEGNLVAAFGANKFRKLSDEEAQDYIPCCMSKCVRTEPVMGAEQPKRKRVKRKVKA